MSAMAWHQPGAGRVANLQKQGEILMTVKPRLVRASLIALACLFVLAAQAAAESDSSNYVTGQLSTLLQGNVEIDSEAYDLERGFGASVAVGRKLSLLRVELEFAYQDMNQSASTQNGNTLAGTYLPSLVEEMRLSLLRQSDVLSATLASDDWMNIGQEEVDAYDLRMMVNGWYDVELMPRLSLFAGGGIGLAHTSLSATYETTATFDVEKMRSGEVVSEAIPSRYYSTLYNERSWGLGYQAGVGVSFAISERGKLGVSYRFIGTDDLQVHSVFAGLQYLM